MSKGYADEPKDLPEGSPYWAVQGWYGYWIVEQRTVGETGCRGMLSPLTRKLATSVASELNQTYRRGLHDRVHPDQWCRDRGCAGWTALDHPQGDQGKA